MVFSQVNTTHADIEAVYQCLQTEYGVGQEDLILCGQSVGSGLTLHLAAHLPRLRGVVLHSGILCGLRVVCHVKFSFFFDIYKATVRSLMDQRRRSLQPRVISGLHPSPMQVYSRNGEPHDCDPAQEDPSNSETPCQCDRNHHLHDQLLLPN
ncbi:hypothetical protein GW17_00042408 [Ensete ventricosum]|nr:hypothetical protein GW17_00042408 [Ensete ventricosum]